MCFLHWIARLSLSFVSLNKSCLDVYPQPPAPKSQSLSHRWFFKSPLQVFWWQMQTTFLFQVRQDKECGGEVALVGEESVAISFAFTRAMYTVHSLWQLLGSAMANSRIAFISRVSCSMIGARGGIFWILGGNFERVVYGSDTKCEHLSTRSNQ